MNRYYKLKRISLVDTKFGKDIIIKMVSLYENEEWKTNIKIDEDLIKILQDLKIYIEK